MSQQFILPEFTPRTRALVKRRPERNVLRHLSVDDQDRYLRLKGETPFAQQTIEDKKFFRNIRGQIARKNIQQNNVQRSIDQTDSVIENERSGTRQMLRMLQGGGRDLIDISPIGSVLNSVTAGIFGVPQLFAEVDLQNKNILASALEVGKSAFTRSVALPPDQLPADLQGSVGQPQWKLNIAQNGIVGISLEEAAEASGAAGSAATGILGKEDVRSVFEQDHPWLDMTGRVGGLIGGAALSGFGISLGAKSLSATAKGSAIIRGTRLGSEHGRSFSAGFSVMDDILFGGSVKGIKPLEQLAALRTRSLLKAGKNLKQFGPAAEPTRLARLASNINQAAKRATVIGLSPLGQEFAVGRDVQNPLLAAAFRPTTLIPGIRVEDPYVQVGPIFLPRDYLDAVAQDFTFATALMTNGAPIASFIGKRRALKLAEAKLETAHDVSTAAFEDMKLKLEITDGVNAQLNSLVEDGNVLTADASKSLRQVMEDVDPNVVIDPDRTALNMRTDGSAMDAKEISVGQGGIYDGLTLNRLEGADPDIKFRDGLYFNAEGGVHGKQVQLGLMDGSTYGPYDEMTTAINQMVDDAVRPPRGPTDVGAGRPGKKGKKTAPRKIATRTDATSAEDSPAIMKALQKGEEEAAEYNRLIDFFLGRSAAAGRRQPGRFRPGDSGIVKMAKLFPARDISQGTVAVSGALGTRGVNKRAKEFLDRVFSVVGAEGRVGEIGKSVKHVAGLAPVKRAEGPLRRGVKDKGRVAVVTDIGKGTSEVNQVFKLVGNDAMTGRAIMGRLRDLRSASAPSLSSLPEDLVVYMPVKDAKGLKKSAKNFKVSRVFLSDPGGDTASFVIRKGDIGANMAIFGDEGVLIQNAKMRPLSAGSADDAIRAALASMQNLEGADPTMVKKVLGQLLEAHDIERMVQQGTRLTITSAEGGVQHLANAETGEVLGNIFRTVHGKLRRVTSKAGKAKSATKTPVKDTPLIRGLKKRFNDSKFTGASIEDRKLTLRFKDENGRPIDVTRDLKKRPLTLEESTFLIDEGVAEKLPDNKKAFLDPPVVPAQKIVEDVSSGTVAQLELAGTRIDIEHADIARGVESGVWLDVPVAALDSVRLSKIEGALVSKLRKSLPQISDENLLKIATAPARFRYHIARSVIAKTNLDNTVGELRGLKPPRGSSKPGKKDGDMVTTAKGRGRVTSLSADKSEVRVTMGDGAKLRLRPSEVTVDISPPTAHSAAQEIVAHMEKALGNVQPRADRALRQAVHLGFVTKTAAKKTPGKAHRSFVIQQRARATKLLPKTKDLLTYARSMTDVPVTRDDIGRWLTEGTGDLDGWARNNVQIGPSGGALGTAVLGGTLSTLALTPLTMEEEVTDLNRILAETDSIVDFKIPEPMQAGIGTQGFKRIIEAIAEISAKNLTIKNLIKSLKAGGAKAKDLERIGLKAFLKGRKNITKAQLRQLAKKQQVSGRGLRAAVTKVKREQSDINKLITKLQKREGRGTLSDKGREGLDEAIKQKGALEGLLTEAQEFRGSNLAAVVGDPDVPVQIVQEMAPDVQLAHIMTDAARATDVDKVLAMSNKYWKIMRNHGPEDYNNFLDTLADSAQLFPTSTGKKASFFARLFEMRMRNMGSAPEDVAREFKEMSKRDVFTFGTKDGNLLLQFDPKKKGIGGLPTDVELDLSDPAQLNALMWAVDQTGALTPSSGSHATFGLQTRIMNAKSVFMADRDLSFMLNVLDARDRLYSIGRAKFQQQAAQLFVDAQGAPLPPGEMAAISLMARGFGTDAKPMPALARWGQRHVNWRWISEKTMAKAKARATEGEQVISVGSMVGEREIKAKFIAVQNPNPEIPVQFTDRARSVADTWRATVLDPLALLNKMEPGQALEHYLPRFYSRKTIKQFADEGLLSSADERAFRGSGLFPENQVSFAPNEPIPGPELIIRLLFSRKLPDLGLAFSDPRVISDMYVRGAMRKIAYDPVLNYWNGLTMRKGSRQHELSKLLSSEEITVEEFEKRAAAEGWRHDLRAPIRHEEGQAPMAVKEMDRVLRNVLGIGATETDQAYFERLTKIVSAKGEPPVTVGERFVQKQRWWGSSLEENAESGFGSFINMQAFVNFMSDPGTRPAMRVSNFVKGLEFMRKIGFSLSTPLVNFTQYYINNVSQVRLSPTGIASTLDSFMFSEQGKHLKKAFKMTGVADSSIFGEFDAGMMETILTNAADLNNTSGGAKLVRRLGTAAGFLFKTSEQRNQFKSWALAVSEARRGRVFNERRVLPKVFGKGTVESPGFVQGKPITDETVLNLIGINAARRTQYSGRVLRPRAFQDPIGGMALQFQTYNFRQTGLIMSQLRQAAGGARAIKELRRQGKGLGTSDLYIEAWDNLMAPVKTLAAMAGFAGLLSAGGVKGASAASTFFGFVPFIDERKLRQSGKLEFGIGFEGGPATGSVLKIVNDIIKSFEAATDPDKDTALQIVKTGLNFAPVGEIQLKRLARVLMEDDLTAVEKGFLFVGQLAGDDPKVMRGTVRSLKRRGTSRR